MAGQMVGVPPDPAAVPRPGADPPRSRGSKSLLAIRASVVEAPMDDSTVLYYELRGHELSWPGGSLVLSGCDVGGVSLTPADLCVRITVPTSGAPRSTLLRPPAEVASLWLEGLQRASRPRWVEDGSQVSCAVCNAPFDIGHRHHCRRCGDLVCSSCSEHSVQLPGLGYGTVPERVCDRCWGDQCGTVLDHYRLGETVGTGTHSTVRVATQLGTGTRVAVKSVSGAAAGSCLRNEALMLAAAGHAHVLRVHQLFTGPTGADEEHLVTEYMSGGDVRTLLSARSGGRGLPEADARRIVGAVLEAVAHAHAHGLVHRDIKPENVLLVDARHPGSAVLADWGFAMTEDDALNAEISGALGYLSPEVISRRLFTSKADVWAVGVLTAVTLTGQMPFRGKTDNALSAEIQAHKELACSGREWRAVSDAAKQFVRAALEPDPDARPTAEELLVRHQGWVSSPSAPSSPASAASPSSPRISRFSPFSASSSSSSSSS